MEYVYPIGWLLLAFALLVYGANIFRRKECPEAPDVEYTVCLLLDVANYLNADASKGGRDYRAKLEIEAQRLEAYGRKETR